MSKQRKLVKIADLMSQIDIFRRAESRQSAESFQKHELYRMLQRVSDTRSSVLEYKLSKAARSRYASDPDEFRLQLSVWLNATETVVIGCLRIASPLFDHEVVRMQQFFNLVSDLNRPARRKFYRELIEAVHAAGTENSYEELCAINPASVSDVDTSDTMGDMVWGLVCQTHAKASTYNPARIVLSTLMNSSLTLRPWRTSVIKRYSNSETAHGLGYGPHRIELEPIRNRIDSLPESIAYTVGKTVFGYARSHRTGGPHMPPRTQTRAQRMAGQSAQARSARNIKRVKIEHSKRAKNVQQTFLLDRIPYWHDFANAWAWQASMVPNAAHYIAKSWAVHGQGGNVLHMNGMDTRRGVQDEAKAALLELKSLGLRSVNLNHMYVSAYSQTATGSNALENCKHVCITPQNSLQLSQTEVAFLCGSNARHCLCGLPHDSSLRPADNATQIMNHTYRQIMPVKLAQRKKVA